MNLACRVETRIVTDAKLRLTLNSDALPLGLKASSIFLLTPALHGRTICRNRLSEEQFPAKKEMHHPWGEPKLTLVW